MKSIGSAQGSESQAASRQTFRRLWLMVFGAEIGREVWGRASIRIGFAKDQCFQFGEKELWRCGKGR